jgi:hypothetical protein
MTLPNLQKLLDEGFVKVMEHGRTYATYKKDNIQILYDKAMDLEVHRYDMHAPFGRKTK